MCTPRAQLQQLSGTLSHPIMHLRLWRLWHRQKTSSALFFKYNSQLGPPYQVLVDTNFINFAIKNKVRSLQHLTSLTPHMQHSACCSRARCPRTACSDMTRQGHIPLPAAH